MGAVLILIYLCLVLAPLGLAWVQDLQARALLDELATGTGMAALAILLVEFLLSGRFRTISRPFGMDVTMRFHQLLARTALALVVLHPVLYTTWDKRPQGHPQAFQSVTYDATGLLTGIAAFLLLGAIIAMAMNRSDLGYRYELWRLIHGLTATAMAGLAVFHATDLGRYSAAPALYWYWWGLFALAVLSLLFVYIVKPLARLRRPWHVAHVAHVAERMWHITLAPEGHDGLTYQAGQFAWARFGQSAFGLNENPFSIASAPAAGPEVSFLIKELGDSTRSIGALKPGTCAYLDAPHGHLTIANRDAPGIALIAGGVGLAPMLGILREMKATGDTRPTSLLYGNRHKGQIAFSEELDTLTGEVHHVLTEPDAHWTGDTGYIDHALLARHFTDRTDWLFVLCGPPPMLDAVEDALIALGVPARNILSERFVYD